ncbi:MAG: 50S ribosome-binding GTPase, partial [Burkholderiales bacterium]|nr:50S ribosome-binding GTPase [Burkholderiales bacterium]
MKPTIVLVGRPNVGKSTLFNRLTRSQAALVADWPGLTRDRHYGHGRVGDKPYLVVDTGGFEPVATEGILHQMARQTLLAVDEADAIVFLVDARQGLTGQDKTIADTLRRSGRPVYVAVNKAEGMDRAAVAAEFHELGLGEPLPISASHGDGVAELMDIVLAPFTEAEDAGERAPVLLVTQRLRSAAEKSLYDLRDKTVLDFSPDEVTAITFTNEGRRVRLVRESKAEEGAQPGWRLVEPFRARADRGLVERMFNLISYLRAEEFVSERPERLQQYGLAPAWGSVRFEFPGGRSETLLFGQQMEVGATTRYFARRPEGGPIFTINDNLPREARRFAGEWRDRRVTDFVRSDVEQLRLISPQRAVVCVKVGKDGGVHWRLAEYAGRVAEAMDLGAAARLPTAQLADRDRVEELLGKLATLE